MLETAKKNSEQPQRHYQMNWKEFVKGCFQKDISDKSKRYSLINLQIRKCWKNQKGVSVKKKVINVADELEFLEGCFKKSYRDKFSDREVLEELEESFCKKVINFTEGCECIFIRMTEVICFQSFIKLRMSEAKFYQIFISFIIPLSRTELFSDSDA